VGLFCLERASEAYGIVNSLGSEFPKLGMHHDFHVIHSLILGHYDDRYVEYAFNIQPASRYFPALAISASKSPAERYVPSIKHPCPFIYDT